MRNKKIMRILLCAVLMMVIVGGLLALLMRYVRPGGMVR